MTFTREDKLREIAREIALRRRVYPQWIKAGKMKQWDADAKIAIMLEIAKDYGGHGDEQEDYTVGCSCGWIGKQSQLTDTHDPDIEGTKFCPSCGKEFVGVTYKDMRKK